MSAPAAVSPSALHPNLSGVQAERVAYLRRAISAGEGSTEVLEAARALIDKVIVSRGEDPEYPQEIERRV